MQGKPTLEDIVGIGHSKLGFFKEVQVKIEELNRSNLELERERKHVQAILDGITDIVAVISPEYRIRSVNHSFFETYQQGDPSGAKCYEVFRGRTSPCGECVLREAVRTNAVCRKNAIILINGKNRQFEITASPFNSSEQSPGELIVVKRDVTREKDFQAKYYHAEKMATIGLLAAGVAHEINNPLTAIQGFTDGLRRRMRKIEPHLEEADLADDVNEYLDIIRDECRRCSGIVQSLLDFSPRRQADFSRVNLNHLVENVLKLLQHRLKQHPETSLHLDLEDDLPEINGMPAELEQVILNLVLNSLDAVSGVGDISIRTAGGSEDRRVRLEVEDNGHGIAPENKPKLFEPFFTTKPVGKGIGIGLSTCYHIIESHGGEITVDSIPGRGALFRVYIPAAESAQEAI